MKCQVCGSGKLKKVKRQEKVQVGDMENFIEIYYGKCPVCNEETFLEKNDTAFKKAKKELLLSKVSSVLAKLEKEDGKYSNIERQASLPLKTLSKWKNGSVKPSATAIAFVRVLGHFPWITKTLEVGVDDKRAREIAMTELLFENYSSKTNVAVHYESDDDSKLLIAFISEDRQNNVRNGDVFYNSYLPNRRPSYNFIEEDDFNYFSDIYYLNSKNKKRRIFNYGNKR